MKYPQAQDIARTLANENTQAAKYLRIMCEQTGRVPTFIIMRYGDPRHWSSLPVLRDNRASKRIRPKTLSVASKIAKQVLRSGGEVATALNRRIRVLESKGYKKHLAARIILRDGHPNQWPEVTNGLRSKKGRRALTLARPCDLEHLDGRRISAPSIVAFCEKAGLNHPNDRFHVTPVLDGVRPSFKGWYLPEALSRKLTMRDVYGNIGEYSLKDLITKYNVPACSAFALLDGRRKTIGVRGRSRCLTLAENEISQFLTPRNTYVTKVEMTNGKKTYVANSMPKMAGKICLKSPGSLYQVAYGFRDEVKGFRVKNIKIAKRSVLSKIA